MAKVVTDYRAVYAPHVWLEANAKFASDLLADVQSFEFEDDEKKPNEVTLIVNNPYNKYTDDPRFQEGVRFRTRWGYLGDFSDNYEVGIAKAAPVFPSPGTMPTLTMKAWDLRADMNRAASPTNYGAISSSSVAKKVAEKYKLETDIEESNDARKQMRVQPAGTTDIQYIMGLAGKLNWDCFIEGNILHFHKKKLDQTPVLTFHYFDDNTGTILEFKPDVKLQKPGKAKKGGSNTKDGKKASGSAGPNNGTVMGRYVVNATEAKFGGKVQTVPLQKPSPETDKNVNTAQAAGLKQKIDMSAVTATMKVVGTPRLKARTTIRIEGVGKTYSGNWRVASTKHKVDSKGYFTDVKLTRNGLNDGKKKADKTNDKTGGGGKNGPPQKVVEVNGVPATFGATKYK